jgi:putative PIN family toxin of toxin-antitoxin system
MLRVVDDTNVFVGGILSKRGAPAQVLDAWRDRRYLLVSSPALIAEVQAVLNYPRIRDKYALRAEDVEAVGALLEHAALQVQGHADVTGSVPGDPKDEMILACAVEGEANLILSGDHHLLELGAFRDIPILTVQQFLERLD